MPRISADSVAEHVAQQQRAVFDAAIDLFVERGYGAVTLSDIAAKVGLARNSLYRYYPDKAAILVEWFRVELPLQAERSSALLAGDDPPAVRVQRWAEAQIDYACLPEHALIVALGEATPGLAPEVLAELAASHDQLVAPFVEVLREAGLTGSSLDSAQELIWGLVLAQAQRELRVGADPDGRGHLAAAVRAIVVD